MSDKVENILKGSLDSIPSPSPWLKIQILGKTSNWGVKKNIAGQIAEFKKFVDIAQQCFAYYVK